MPIVLAPSGVSAYTYGQLLASIADWMHRSDLAGSAPEFVRLAESDIRHDVRVQAMEAEQSGAISGTTIAHPTRYIEARRLVVDGVPLSYIVPERFARYQRFGEPGNVYTSIGQQLRVTRGAGYSLIFWQSFAPLAAPGDTNWLMQNAMEVYLFGALKHAALWAMDDAQAQKFATLYQGAVSRINGREQASRYSGGPLQIMPPVVE